MDDFRDRYRGALIGTFLGDAFGLPFEGTPKGALSDLSHRVRRRAERPIGWGYSDDTEMMIGVAESLIECGRLDAQHLLGQLEANYDAGRGYGKALRFVLSCSERSGIPQWESRGCGAAVRVAPIACFYSDFPENLVSAVEASARVTHTHSEAVSAAVIQGLAIGYLVRIPSPEEYRLSGVVDHLLSHAPNTPEALVNNLRWIEDAEDVPLSTDEIVERLGHSPLAIEAVSAALCAFSQFPGSGADALCCAMRLGGDTDSIAALTGALSGALLGENGFPPGWLEALEEGPKGAQYVMSLADRLQLQ